MRGKRVVELAVDDAAINAKLARRLMLTPEWDRMAVKSAAEQRKLLDEGNVDVIGKFKSAGVTVSMMSPAEVARIQEKVKPVVDKFAPQIGEDFVKGFYAEIDKARAAK